MPRPAPRSCASCIMRRAPVLVASSSLQPGVAQHVRGSRCAEQPAGAGERDDIFDLREVRRGRPQASLEDLEPAAEAERERQRGKRTGCA